MFRTAVMSALVIATSISTASAETVTVCASGCDYSSINAAIADASDGDVIQLSAETYFEGEQIDTLGKAITLRGVLDKAGEPASVLDGAWNHRVLVCQSGEKAESVFVRLVIRNGMVDGDDVGGGMYTENTGPTVIECTFTSNFSATGGGGMYCLSGAPTLTHCSFEENNGEDGGGMYLLNSSPNLTGCAFDGNSAGRGGGIGSYGGSSPSLTNCTFTNNWAASFGGGMDSWSSTPALADCLFENNSAEQGGGIYNDSNGSLSLTNCNFVNNWAERDGGGMFNLESSLILANCTFAANSTDSDGGGIHNYRGIATLSGCTFTQNSACHGSGMWNYESTPTLTDCTFMECCQVDPPRSIIDLGGNDYDSWCDDCRADLDCRNDAVDAEDLGYLLARWGTDDPQSDIDGDGVVRAADLGLLFAAWGPCQ